MLGQLANAAQQGNLGNVANQSGGGLMGMLASLFGGLLGNSASPQSTLDNLTKMFQPGNLPAEINQSGLTDQIGKILSGSKS